MIIANGNPIDDLSLFFVSLLKLALVRGFPNVRTGDLDGREIPGKREGNFNRFLRSPPEEQNFTFFEDCVMHSGFLPLP